MEVNYRRDRNHSYMILSGMEMEAVDTSAYPFRMITANRLENFLECSLHIMDQKPLFYFEITSRQSLKVILETQNLGYEELRSILESLLSAMQELGRYLLDSGGILLDPEVIYRNPDSSKVQFAFLPGYSQDFSREFQFLAEFLLTKINHQDKKAVILGYGLYRKVTEEEMSEKLLREVLYLTEEAQDEGEEAEEEPKAASPSEDFSRENLVEDEFDREREEILEQLFSEEKKAASRTEMVKNILAAAGILILVVSIPAVKWFSLSTGWYVFITLIVAVVFIIDAVIRHRTGKQKSYRNFRQSEEAADGNERNEIFPDQNTELPTAEEDEEYGETVILQAPLPETGARLVPVSPVTFPVLLLGQNGMKLIGKMERAADLVIPAETVSRIHARVQYLNECWQIQDLNSRNGTFINGRALQGEEWHEMEEGEEVSFADVIYRFQLK